MADADDGLTPEQRYYATARAFLHANFFGKDRDTPWREYWYTVHWRADAMHEARAAWDGACAPDTAESLAFARSVLEVVDRLQWIGRSARLSAPRALVLERAGAVPSLRALSRLGSNGQERDRAFVALWAMGALEADAATTREAEELAHSHGLLAMVY